MKTFDAVNKTNCIKILFSLSFGFFAFSSFSQARLILEGDVVLNINGGTSSNPVYVVVDNSNSNAVIANGGAHINSESEFNLFRWVIEDGTGTFEVPFGDENNELLPIVLEITSSGSSNGHVDFSTYPTSSNNLPFPTGVNSIAHQNDPNNEIAQGVKTYDRFWLIQSSHDTKPSGNMSFSYLPTALTGDLLNPGVQLGVQFFDGTNWSLSQFGVDNGAGLVSAIPFSNSSFGSAWALVESGAALPITLLHFNAVWNNNAQSEARVFWSTASETENEFFQVQRSQNGVNWENIQKVQGAGTSIQNIDYQIIDLRPLNGVSYYRLKQVDFDGTATYSNVVSLQRDETKSSFLVFPNPAKNEFNLLFSGVEDEFINVKILDNSGRLVLETNPNILKSAVHSIDASNFKSGVYHIQVGSEKEFMTQKIVICE